LIARGVIPGDIDFVVLDVQGAELRVLRGAAAFLAAPTLLGLMIEVSADPLYEGGATYLDLCRHLQPLGFFTRSVEFNEDGWGDAIFTRRSWKLADDEVPPLFRDYAPEFAGRNIAPEGRCSQSSIHALQGAAASDRAVHAPRGPGFSFHTEREACPWWQVEFAAPRRFDEVIVFNRLDEGRNRAYALRIEVSDDLVGWRKLWTNEYSFGGVDGRPLRVECPDTWVRALRILGSPDEFLHLNRIEIYDRSAPAA
jgi:F5/8 type C domain/Methyltransferase FkbM domain